MAANNLRIIYQNVVDLADTVITASTTASSLATPASNLKTDTKSAVWRSAQGTTSAVGAFLVVAVPGGAKIGGVIAAFSNLSSAATIRVKGYTGAVPTVGGTADVPTINESGSTIRFDNGGVLCSPYQAEGTWNWGYNPLAQQAYQNKKVYGRAWLTLAQQQEVCTSFSIEVFDPNSKEQFIEISRLILGSYWSPKYNTGYGIEAGVVDLSTSTRTESGDLLTTELPYFSTLKFDLKFMVKQDRDSLYSILRALGTRKAMFVSAFPDNQLDWGKEGVYQCYGKFAQLPGISHSMYEMYSSDISIEEVQLSIYTWFVDT